MTNHQLVVVTTTHDDETRARELATTLVRERLAACAQLYPITSVYRWDGEIQTTPEWRIDLKTRPDLTDRLTTRIAELHPYDTPEIIAVPVPTASTPYLTWVTAETAP